MNEMCIFIETVKWKCGQPLTMFFVGFLFIFSSFFEVKTVTRNGCRTAYEMLMMRLMSRYRLCWIFVFFFLIEICVCVRVCECWYQTVCAWSGRSNRCNYGVFLCSKLREWNELNWLKTPPKNTNFDRKQGIWMLFLCRRYASKCYVLQRSGTIHTDDESAVNRRMNCYRKEGSNKMTCVWYSVRSGRLYVACANESHSICEWLIN